MDKRYRYIAAGPVIFAVVFWALQGPFTYAAAGAVATVAWMGLWWVLRPVHVSVTALLPIVLNAMFGFIPNADVTSQYFSETIILLLGSDLICLTWTTTGLDRRISVKALSYIGPSLRQQVSVWLLVSVILSIFLPNVVVAAIFCPIAVAMAHASGLKGAEGRAVLAPIMLAIAWGSGIGGFGSPIGSSSNMVSLSYLEDMTGHEFLYIDWVIRFLPVLGIVTVLNLIFLWTVKTPLKELSGTRDYFKKLMLEFGPMKRGEWIALMFFVTATVLAFARPLWAWALPTMKPVYIYLLFGIGMFVVRDEHGKMMLEWKYAQEHVMWGILLLIASGLAAGRMLIETGAVDGISAVLMALNIPGGMILMLVCCAFSSAFSELSSNAAAAAIALPIVLNLTVSMGLNPVPYVLASIVAVNCAYILPLSTRAIPVSFGLDPGVMTHEGTKLALLNVLLTSVVCYGLSVALPIFQHF